MERFRENKVWTFKHMKDVTRVDRQVERDFSYCWQSHATRLRALCAIVSCENSKTKWFAKIFNTCVVLLFIVHFSHVWVVHIVLRHLNNIVHLPNLINCCFEMSLHRTTVMCGWNTYKALFILKSKRNMLLYICLAYPNGFSNM